VESFFQSLFLLFSAPTHSAASPGTFLLVTVAVDGNDGGRELPSLSGPIEIIFAGLLRLFAGGGLRHRQDSGASGWRGCPIDPRGDQFRFCLSTAGPALRHLWAAVQWHDQSRSGH
jgi:hypothetical protein